jgi:hypothetical protein
VVTKPRVSCCNRVEHFDMLKCRERWKAPQATSISASHFHIFESGCCQMWGRVPYVFRRNRTCCVQNLTVHHPSILFSICSSVFVLNLLFPFHLVGSLSRDQILCSSSCEDRFPLFAVPIDIPVKWQRFLLITSTLLLHTLHNLRPYSPCQFNDTHT